MNVTQPLGTDLLSDDDFDFEINLIVRPNDPQIGEQLSALCTYTYCVTCQPSTECWTCHVCP